MNSRIRLVSILLALAVISPALAEASGTLPAGATISVVTDQSVSSKTAKIGQTISGTVSQNVTSGGSGNGRRGRDWEKRHRVSSGNKASLHYTGCRGNQLVRIPA